jgi:DNA-binding NarL/FixJ family response regulator
MAMIKVIIVSDLPLFCCGIRSTLERKGDCIVVGESTNAAEIIELVHRHQPDVVLIDGALTSVNAFEVVQLLHQNDVHGGIFVFAPSRDEEYLFQFVRLGAVAYELSTIAQDDLIDKVLRVSRGEYLISGEVLSSLPRPLLPLQAHDDLLEQENETAQKLKESPLSSREMEILENIARGNSNKEIAKILKISDQTVKNHITSILKKLDVNDRTAAVVYALRKKWIKIESLADSHGGREQAVQAVAGRA